MKRRKSAAVSSRHLAKAALLTSQAFAEEILANDSCPYTEEAARAQRHQHLLGMVEFYVDLARKYVVTASAERANERGTRQGRR